MNTWHSHVIISEEITAGQYIWSWIIIYYEHITCEAFLMFDRYGNSFLLLQGYKLVENPLLACLQIYVYIYIYIHQKLGHISYAKDLACLLKEF